MCVFVRVRVEALCCTRARTCPIISKVCVCNANAAVCGSALGECGASLTNLRRVSRARHSRLGHCDRLVALAALWRLELQQSMLAGPRGHGAPAEGAGHGVDGVGLAVPRRGLGKLRGTL